MEKRPRVVWSRLTLQKDLLPGETVTFSSTVSLPAADQIDGQLVTEVSVAAFTIVVPQEPAQFLSVQYYSIKNHARYDTRTDKLSHSVSRSLL